jgi:opacity protein-like surface antigen
MGAGLLAMVVCLSPLITRAGEPISPPDKGTQTVGLAIGPFFPIRLMSSQSSKLFGTAIMPSWSMIATDPIGSTWYRGQVSFGAELLAFVASEPVTGYGVGITPKLHYSFISFDRLRPYIEGGAGPLWTDLGGQVPEQPGQFNFAVWGGAGAAWILTPQWAVNVGYRFVHISNGGTSTPNSGLNFGLPFVGLSYSLY